VSATFKSRLSNTRVLPLPFFINRSVNIAALSSLSSAKCLSFLQQRRAQHLLWSFREGYATQWSSLEIRTLTGFNGWDDLMTGVQREFSCACDQVEKAVNGTLTAPPVPETTVHTSFPDDDNDAFYLQIAELSQLPMELP